MTKLQHKPIVPAIEEVTKLYDALLSDNKAMQKFIALVWANRPDMQSPVKAELTELLRGLSDTSLITQHYLTLQDEADS